MPPLVMPQLAPGIPPPCALGARLGPRFWVERPSNPAWGAMQPPGRARVADVASRNTTGHERAVLEKLAEVAPEVLHGADSLQTMHSFMAALALVLDDATFARVLAMSACAAVLAVSKRTMMPVASTTRYGLTLWMVPNGVVHET